MLINIEKNAGGCGGGGIGGGRAVYIHPLYPHKNQKGSFVSR